MKNKRKIRVSRSLVFVGSCFMFFLTNTASAQEAGLLASILNDDCKKYVSDKESKKSSYEYETFCSGYFEAVIEYMVHVEKKPVFSCFPTYAEFDPYKKLVIQNFMSKFETQHTKGNKYIRAFNLARESADELFNAKCSDNPKKS